MTFVKRTAESLPVVIQEWVYGKQAVQRKDTLETVLADHADTLASGKGDAASYLNKYAGDAELMSLLPLAERIGGVLRPVAPAPGFQSRLLNDLMRQAHAQQEPGAPFSLWEDRRREIIIGATITSLISAAGVLAYFLHLTPFNRRSNTSPT